MGSFLAFLGTTASMIAVINNLVGGATVALLVHAAAPSLANGVCAAAGLVSAFLLTLLFYRYQRWRFADYDDAKGTVD